MKTFEEIIDKLWKPSKVYTLDKKLKFKSKGWKEQKNKILVHKKSYSSTLSKTFYGKDINEPIVKVCKRILDKPSRFNLVKEESFLSYTARGFLLIDKVSWKVIEDKDTKQKFCRGDWLKVISIPSFLTEDEVKLLVSCLDTWYEYNQKVLIKKNEEREKKRKDKFRQEMIELYKDL